MSKECEKKDESFIKKKNFSSQVTESTSKQTNLSLKFKAHF